MKKILFRISALLIGIGFVLIALELFLRLNPKFGYVYSFCRFKNKELEAINSDNLGYLRPCSLLGYEIIPNCKSVNLPVSSNAYGLIGKEYKLEKEKDVFRILLIGDSIAWQDISRQFLEKELNNTGLLNSKYKFEIWNSGVPSYDVRRYYLFLKHKGLHYKPDMVMVFFSMNDFDLNINIYYKDKNGTSEYYFPLKELSKRYIVSPFMMSRSYLYRFIVLRLENYLLSKKRLSDTGEEEYNGRYYLRLIKGICEENRIPLLAVIFPYLKPLNKYNQKENREYQTICGVISDLEIPHINLYNHLPEAYLYILREKKEDQIHPGYEGHRIIAGIIYKYLLDNFFKND